MNLEGLKAGDKVTVYRRFSGGIERFAAVAKSGKRKIALEDGSEWSMRGRRWGSKDYWSGAWIEPYSPEHETHLANQKVDRRRQQIAIQLADHRWRDESIETLEAVLKLIQKPANGAEE